MSNPVSDISWLKILLAEDEPLVVQTIREMLRDSGLAHIVVAKDGRDALDFLGEAREPIHLVIADWNMPRMTGIELLTQVRTTGSQIPFLLLTGRADRESVEQAKQLGVNAYLRKPFSADQLRNKLIILSKHIRMHQQMAS